MQKDIKIKAEKTIIVTPQTFEQWEQHQQQYHESYQTGGPTIFVAFGTHTMPDLQKLKDYHNEVNEYLEEAVKYLDQTGESPLYRKWFGKPDPRGDNLKQVKDNFRETKDGLTKPYVYNFFPEKLCGVKFLAHVDSTLAGKRQHVVNVCPLLFKSTTNEREQIITLIHEMTHDSAATLDKKLNGNVCYGEELCLELAKKEPDNATNNADNYALFADEVNTINKPTKKRKYVPGTDRKNKRTETGHRLIRLLITKLMQLTVVSN